MNEILSLLKKHKPQGYRLDRGDDVMDYTREELQDDSVMFLAMDADSDIPDGFEAHHEYLGSESYKDEPYVRVCIRIPDEHQRTMFMLALQTPVLDKQKILGRK
jgi:hypothetical protein